MTLSVLPQAQKSIGGWQYSVTIGRLGQLITFTLSTWVPGRVLLQTARRLCMYCSTNLN